MGLPTFSQKHFDALAASRDLAPTASHITKLSSEFGEDIARWSFEQWELRRRARSKFERADAMLFDRDGLEMATSEPLAELHVRRFPRGVRMADLTCGIGADLIAIARNGPAIGYETEPLRAAMTIHNLAVHGLEADIRVQSCMDGDWDFDYAFADPSRRVHGSRVAEPAQFSPRPDALIERMWSLSLGGIKLSPMLPDAFLEGLGGERWFLSHQRECREAMILVGRQHVFDDGTRSHGCWAAKTGHGPLLLGDAELPAQKDEPEVFLLEADAAAIRAHALGDLCSHFDASPLGDSNGYLTATSFNLDSPAAPWVRIFRVLAFGHADERRIRADLRHLEAGVDIVKTRGVRENPTAWKKRLRNTFTAKVCLVLYPVGKSMRYALLKAHP